MRMRFKPYARPELAAWEHCIDHPEAHAGHWRTLFTDPTKSLRVELGCGKGRFLAELAQVEPAYNYLGFDIKSEMLVVAKRTIESSFIANKRAISNLKIAAYNIEQIGRVLAEEDVVDRLYINFCNPWYKSGHAKHRLTHPRQLIQYRKFLRPDGELYFKTDDGPLFRDSLRYFALCGFEVVFQTQDLHREGGMSTPITEHEEMFSREGIQINACIAVKHPAQLDPSAFARIKNI